VNRENEINRLNVTKQSLEHELEEIYNLIVNPKEFERISINLNAYKLILKDLEILEDIIKFVRYNWRFSDG
jgi:formylmethanofuran dehydrogenase subunit C